MELINKNDNVLSNGPNPKCNLDSGNLDSFEDETDSGTKKTNESIHSKLLEEEIPKIGMEFETEEAAHVFYNSYAKRVGFSTRKSASHSDRYGNVLDRVFCCSCEGTRVKDKRDILVKSHRAQTRCGCLAMMKINIRVCGKFRIDKFVTEHNHALASPSKSYFGRSHRTIKPAQAAEIELFNAAGIAPKAGYEMMARRAGGPDNLGFTLVDYKNYLRSKRTTENKKNTQATNESTVDNEDPETMIEYRYKELSWIFMKLATKAAESNEAFNIAKSGGLHLLQQVNACLEKRKIQEPSDGCLLANDDLMKEIEVELEKDDGFDIPGQKIESTNVKERSADKSRKRVNSGTLGSRKKNRCSQDSAVPLITSKQHQNEALDSHIISVVHNILPQSAHVSQASLSAQIQDDALVNCLGSSMNKFLHETQPLQLPQIATPPQPAQNDNVLSTGLNSLCNLDSGNCDKLSTCNSFEDHETDSGTKKTNESIHSKLLEEEIPKIGMEFETEEAAQVFYNSYAKRIGFSTRKSKVHTDRYGNVLDRVFCCSCEGTRVKDKRDILIKSHRAETRCGCLAMMKINVRICGKFRIDKFVEEHNHALASPSKSYFGRSHRTIKPAQAAEIELVNAAGIAPKSGYEMMARRAGGPDNLGFTPVDYQNYLHSMRTIANKKNTKTTKDSIVDHEDLENMKGYNIKS